MPNIVKVTPCENYTLEIELDNHHKIIYDMKPRLHAVRFGELANIKKFKSNVYPMSRTIWVFDVPIK